MNKDIINQVVQSYLKYYQDEGLEIKNINLGNILPLADVKQWCKDNNYTYKVLVTPYRLIIITPIK